MLCCKFCPAAFHPECYRNVFGDGKQLADLRDDERCFTCAAVRWSKREVEAGQWRCLPAEGGVELM